MNASDEDLAHLFGIKRPFLDPLYLSQPLHAPRPITADEAAQLCERDAAIKPNTRGAWELAPLVIGGKPHIELRKMSNGGGSRHPEATWILPAVPGDGMLRLSAPLGSGRAVTPEERRQLRSIGGPFAHAHASWTVKPSGSSMTVQIYRYRRDQMLTVGALELVPVARVPAEQRPRRRLAGLPAACAARLSVYF